MNFLFRIITAIVFFIGIRNSSFAFQFKDSTTALFARIEYKHSQGLHYIDHSLHSGFGYSYNKPSAKGFILGLRYSSTIKKIKNNRLSYLFAFNYHYDQSHEIIYYDTFPNQNYAVNIGNGRFTQKGYTSENIVVKLSSLVIHSALKYNFSWFRPALGYWAGLNVGGKTLGSGLISKRAGVFKDNSRKSLKNCLNHGITLEAYIPLFKQFGLVTGFAGSVSSCSINENIKFNSLPFFTHIGIDYKLSK